MFMLPEGLVPNITVPVMEGETVDVPGVGTFRCVTGPCEVDVANNEVTTTGLIEVVSLDEGLPDAVLTELAERGRRRRPRGTGRSHAGAKDGSGGHESDGHRR